MKSLFDGYGWLRQRRTRTRVISAVALAVLIAAAIVLIPRLGSHGAGTSVQARLAGDTPDPIAPGKATQAPAGAHPTIITQRMRMLITTTERQHHQARKHRSILASTTIDEVSAAGTVERTFDADSLAHQGFEQAQRGNRLGVYDPLNNTIYQTTNAAWQAAVNKQVRQRAPKGTHLSIATGTMTFVGTGRSYGPSGGSVFKRELQRHLYRLAGDATIDGRAALKLVPTHPYNPRRKQQDRRQLLGIVYVAPGTDAPIRQVIRLKLTPGFTVRTIENWLSYRVLPDTTTNRRLVSLQARHPSARVVHSAPGYLKAEGQEEQRRVK